MKKHNFILFLVLILSTGVYAESVFEAPERINFSGLPKTAQTFIDTYFKDYNYLYATENSMYKVSFKGNISIYFDLLGNWTDIAGNGEVIPTGYIDSKILQAVSAKYPDGKITKIARRKNKTEVKLVNGTRIMLDNNANITKVSGRK